MAILDRNMEWKRLTRFIPFHAFLGSQVTGASIVLDGFGTGAPVVGEVSDFGYGGFDMEVGDMIACLDYETLSLADVTKEIGVRVRWIDEQGTPAAGDSVTWIALYDQADQGEAMVEPATALSTAIAAHTPAQTVGIKNRRTARGVIDGGTFDAAAKQGVLGWRIEADAVTSYTAGEITFMALEIDYYPAFCVDPTDRDINELTKRTDSENA